MNQTTNTTPEWNLEDPFCISIKWDYFKPPTFTTMIKWRDRLLRFRVSVDPSHNSTVLKVILEFEEKSYVFAWFRGTLGGGANLSKLPPICTSEYDPFAQLEKKYCLKVSVAISGIKLTDQPEDSQAKCDLLITPFKILPYEEVVVVPKVEPLVKEIASVERPEEPMKDVYLYRSKDRCCKVIASFEEEVLEVSYWVIGDYSEYEKNTYVSNENLVKLYEAFGLAPGQKTELLMVLQQTFSGEEAMEDFRKFLSYQKIAFGGSAR